MLTRPSPVPLQSGIYAWFFKEIPGDIPTAGCYKSNNKVLLYVGISPTRSDSNHNLRKRFFHHYAGNCEGSTLRRTLGVLLEKQSGFPLRRVGSGKRITLTHRGEQYLDQWMEENAFVCWIEHPRPWDIEEVIIKSLRCPLNIRGNDHPYVSELIQIRKRALERARRMPIANEDGQSRRTE